MGGTTKTLHANLAADGGVCRFPVDTEGGIDARLLGIGVAGLSDSDDASVFEGQACANQAMGAEDSTDGVPFAGVVGGFEFLPDPVE